MGKVAASIACGVAIASSLAACNSSAKNASGPTSVATPTESTSAPASPTQSAVPTQKPVPAEVNPPGDIPDTTAYVPFHSSAGRFSISVPEGWARVNRTSSVVFSSALNSVTVSWSPASSTATVATAKSTDVPALRASQQAFRLQSVASARLSGGKAVEIIYQVNSKPNPVTGKQYRLVVERFELVSKGQEDVLSLSSPVGADNVDPWRMVSESFRWR